MNFFTISSGKKMNFLNSHEFELGIKFVYQIVTVDDIFICQSVNNDFLHIDWNFLNDRFWASFKKFFN